ncbi:ankyrin [Fusarium pseudoanthophilum]|uniref:Ankyrin n=1 Tax=Fusarium pseudoanthophilum TaxID=48495 RepID=A0A8H5KWU3_9HYPO|nr:ankyrin [Fusarium pseudoanthophilum]
MKNAETEKSESFISVMADLGARFDVTDKQGRTLLHAAVRKCENDREYNILRRLIDRFIELGADPLRADLEGNTIWHEAIPKYAGEEAQGSSSLETLRSITALAHKTALFEYLLQQHGGDVNMRDNDGVTALHIVSTYSTDFTRSLLELGADATLVTEEGTNVFHLTSRCRRSNTIGLLLDWFRERTTKEELQKVLNFKDNRGRSPLYYACASDRFQSVELLINAGAVVEMETYEGSALNGCVQTEEEMKNWQSSSSQTHLPDSGGFLIGLIIANAATPNWHLIDVAIAAAVEMAATENLNPHEKPYRVRRPDHDYTVECLVQARKSLGVEGELLCAPELQQCLQRRENIVKDFSVKKECTCGECYKLPRLVRRLKEQKCYEAIPNYINKLSLNPEDLHSVLVDLTNEGMARILDTLLTPETILGSGMTKDESLSSLMRAACESTEPNMPVIRILVSKGVDLGEAKSPECNFLHVLSQGRREKFSRRGQRPWWHAPWWHTGQALPYLIKRGVYLENRDRQGLTPLNASLDDIEKSAWRPTATEMLLKAGADPNSVDYKGKSCLARAVGNKTVFKLLVGHGAIIDPSLLTSAILAKDVGMVEMILSSGADPNVRRLPSPPSLDEKRRRKNKRYTSVSFDEMYPLDIVIYIIDSSTASEVDCEAYLRMVEMLLEFGADPNARFHNKTVAHKALRKDVRYDDSMPRENFLNRRATGSIRRKYLDLILQHPTLDINLKDGGGVPLLHFAFEDADETSTRMLIDRGADLYARDNLDRTILHIGPSLLSEKALFDEIMALAPELLDQVNKVGRTPLHHALGDRDRFGYLGRIERSEAFAQMLIAAGASVRAKDENGDTPLHLLLQRKWHLLVHEDDSEVWEGPVYPTMELLLSKGADINTRNEMGETPIFAFFRQGDFHVDMTRVYPNKCFGHCSCFYHSEVERQAMEEKRPVLWALFEKVGVDWTAVNAKGQSLLHVVANRGGCGSCFTRLERFKLLMGKGLDPLMEDREHRTALDIAAANRAYDIMELFKLD